MAEIRMCDNCSVIFSLNTEGWDEYQKRNNATMHNGNTKTVHVCPECNGPNVNSGAPRLAISKGASNE